MNERPAGLADIARVFLKIGAMSYGGPAIMGTMQAEVQEKRRWLSKQQFVEGFALVNMLPGPGATQLGILIGHAKAGLPGGILAGVCFILPAFLMMLVLAAAYVAYGALPATQSAFYGIGPVVVGIFAAAIYRLGMGKTHRKDFAMMSARYLQPLSGDATDQDRRDRSTEGHPRRRTGSDSGIDVTTASDLAEINRHKVENLREALNDPSTARRSRSWAASSTASSSPLSNAASPSSWSARPRTS
jgi:chromate transport protein ChrA